MKFLYGENKKWAISLKMKIQKMDGVPLTSKRVRWVSNCALNGVKNMTK